MRHTIHSRTEIHESATGIELQVALSPRIWLVLPKCSLEIRILDSDDLFVYILLVDILFIHLKLNVSIRVVLGNKSRLRDYLRPSLFTIPSSISERTLSFPSPVVSIMLCRYCDAIRSPGLGPEVRSLSMAILSKIQGGYDAQCKLSRLHTTSPHNIYLP